MGKFVIRNNAKLLGTIDSGTGNEQLTLAADGSVTKIPSVDSSVYLSSSLAAGSVYIGNVSNIATAIALSGAITMGSSGVTTLANDLIVNANINSVAAIAYSKLNLAGSILNVDINTSAAIARTKLASGTAYRFITNNASGVLSETSVTGSVLVATDTNGLPTSSGIAVTTAAYLDATSSIQTQLDSRLQFSSAITPNTGDTIIYSGGVWTNLGIGSAGEVLTVSGGGLPSWAAASASGTLPTGGTTNQYLRKIDATNYNTEWDTLALSDISDVTATISQINALATGYYDATSSVQTQIDGKLTSSLTTDNIFVGVGGVATEGTNLPTGITIGTQYIYRTNGTDVTLSDGGTGASLSDPNADRIMFWDDSAGQVTWLQAGTGLTISGTTLTSATTDGDKGDITVSSTGTVWTIDNNVVTFAKLQASVAGLSVIGRAANSAGNFAEITGTANQVVRVSSDGTSVAFGTIGDASIADLAFSKLTTTPTTLAGYGITDSIYLRGGNTFGAASILGLTDNFDLTLQTGVANLIFKTNSTTRLNITSAGVGTVTGNWTLNGFTSVGEGVGSSQLHIGTTTLNDTTRGILIGQHTADTIGAQIAFRKSRGASIGSPTTIATGDNIGRISFNGYTSSGGYLETAAIIAYTNGTVGVASVQTDLLFRVSSTAVGSTDTRLRLTWDEKIGIGAAAKTDNATVSQLHIATASLTDLSRGVLIGQHDSAATNPLLAFRKSRGANISSPTTVADGDGLGNTIYYAYTSSGGYLATSSIIVNVNGTVTSTLAPTDFMIRTSNTDVGTADTRLRITATGLVGIRMGTTSPTAVLQVRGQGTTTNELVKFANSADNARLIILDSGLSGFSTAVPTSTVHITGSFATRVQTITGATTLDSTYSTILCDATSAGFTVTLPAATGCSGRIYNIKKIDSTGNTVTIDGDSAETIDGAATKVINTQYSGYTIQSNGTSWYIIAVF